MAIVDARKADIPGGGGHHKILLDPYLLAFISGSKQALFALHMNIPPLFVSIHPTVNVRCLGRLLGMDTSVGCVGRLPPRVCIIWYLGKLPPRANVLCVYSSTAYE